MYQLFAGLFAEGTTDIRFLENIVQNTLEKVAFECEGQIEVVLQTIEIDKTNLSFVEQVKAASRKGVEDFGMMLLCVHRDADNPSIGNAYKNSIEPARQTLQNLPESEYCRVMVAIVPVQETEAWMLVDKVLLKKQIGTNKKDVELGIHRNPEDIANPKEVIIEAIRIARQGLTKKRRRNLSISNLYLPLGQGMNMQKLEKLPSYKLFEENVRNAFRALNLLHT